MGMKSTPKDPYVCSQCGGTFEKVVLDEEAEAKYKRNFPDALIGDKTIVCDNCYTRFMQWMSRKN
jgi:DNA-directed RNA polymerase subunit RPC12/RpoP